MHVTRYNADFSTHLPVSGGGTDIVANALMKRGPTPGTNQGFLIVAGGTSAVPDTIGIIKAAHTASGNDTNQTGTVFTKKPIELTIPFRVVRVQYDTTSEITCTQAVSTTTMTVTSLEDDIDGAFLYVVEGLGLGQMNFLTAAAAGSCTLKAAFGTSLDTTSKFIKILPRFHKLLGFNTAGTKMSSQAAAGAIKGLVIDSWVDRDGHKEQLNPTKHAALTGLNLLPTLKFYADVCITDSGPYPVV